MHDLDGFFWFRVPIQYTTRTILPGKSTTGHIYRDARPIRVLYLDDHLDFLEIVKVILEKSGEFTVDTTNSAREALDLVRGRMYDAILSDYRMVRMTGTEFLSQARMIKPGIPFIFFTGMDLDEVSIVPSREDDVSYLQKKGDPEVQFAELERRIRNVVRRGDVSPASDPLSGSSE